MLGSNLLDAIPCDACNKRRKYFKLNQKQNIYQIILAVIAEY